MTSPFGRAAGKQRYPRVVRLSRVRKPPAVLAALSLLSLVLGCLAMPATAFAKSPFTWELPHPSKFESTFVVKASNGYSIRVEGWGRNVKLVASRTSPLGSGTTGSGEITEYLTRGSVTKAGLKAKFGNLGEISVTFSPTRTIKKITVPLPLRKQDCRTTVGPDNLGIFVGTIKFAGEAGYTAVDAHRAKGVIGMSAKQVDCQKSSESEAPILSVQTTSMTRSLYFIASTLQASSGNPLAAQHFAFFAAGVREEVGLMAVSRTLIAIGPSSVLVLNSAAGSALVSPPAPFGGTGSFIQNADGSTSWTGSLIANFPGEENVAIVGPGFSGSLSNRLFGQVNGQPFQRRRGWAVPRRASPHTHHGQGWVELGGGRAWVELAGVAEAGLGEAALGPIRPEAWWPEGGVSWLIRTRQGLSRPCRPVRGPVPVRPG